MSRRLCIGLGRLWFGDVRLMLELRSRLVGWLYIFLSYRLMIVLLCLVRLWVRMIIRFALVVG